MITNSIYNFDNQNLFKLKTPYKSTMNKWFELILGLILLVGVVALILPGMPLQSWGTSALIVLKGGLAWIIAIVGLILIILGISEIKG